MPISSVLHELRLLRFDTLLFPMLFTSELTVYKSLMDRSPPSLPPSWAPLPSSLL